MPICSYVVVPERGAAGSVERGLLDVPGCTVARAVNRDVLLLVTDTPTLADEAELRASIEAMAGIQALLLTFGEIDPDTDVPDPISVLPGREDR
jgi:nitrate reductase NapAB chaperone NapD